MYFQMLKKNLTFEQTLVVTLSLKLSSKSVLQRLKNIFFDKYCLMNQIMLNMKNSLSKLALSVFYKFSYILDIINLYNILNCKRNKQKKNTRFSYIFLFIILYS